jgi:hypothetical protein
LELSLIALEATVAMGSCARTCHHSVLLLSVNVCDINYRTARPQTKEEHNSTILMAEGDCRVAEAMFAEGRRMFLSMTGGERDCRK